MVTLAELSARLGSNLQPIFAGRVPDSEVRAVHVSELSDPARFLSGGELLMTTGIPFAKDDAELDAYVAGLVAAGVVGLALGLGEDYEQIPRQLIAACGEAGLPLFAVPPETAFLTITRAFWSQLMQSAGEESWASSFALHRALVLAAADRSRRTEAAVVDTLAARLRRWVVFLDEGTLVASRSPRPTRTVLDKLAGRLARRADDGNWTSLRLTVGVEQILAFPVVGPQQVVGHLCISARDGLEAGDRHAVYHAATVIGTEGRGAPSSIPEAVLQLLLTGYSAAALRLAQESRVSMPDGRCRLLVLRAARDGVDVTGTLTTVRKGLTHVLVPESHPTAELRGFTGALSEAVSLDELAGVAEQTAAVARSAGSGEMLLVQRAGAEVSDWIERLEDHSLAAVPTAIAYLRARGRWDQAGRELGVHRNTVRQRLQSIRESLRIDLDDPDVAARLWLELRARGDLEA